MIRYQEPGLTVFESALFRTTSTVFYNADLILIVDPTWLPEEIKSIQAFVESIQRGQEIFLFFTHSDYDHIIAYGAFPAAQTIASRAFVNQADAAKILHQIREFDESYYVQRDYPITYPEIKIVIEEEGQVLKIGDTQLKFYHAPGHNDDGLFAIVEPYGIWLVGDYLSNIEFPYVYHSFADYRTTVHKIPRLLEQHTFRWLIPGHGDISDQIEEVELRIKESLDYLDALEESVQTGKDFDLEKLWQRYDFPAGMLPFHEGNVRLLKSRIGESF